MNNVTIFRFTICHLFLVYQIEEFSLNILDQISQKVEGLYFSIIIISQILQLFLTLVFLEIIEIKIYNLNKDTNTNIQQRALDDFNLIQKEDNDEDSFSDEENEKKEFD